MSTPLRGLRRVPFASGESPRTATPGLLPSPYTPFSGRRAVAPSSARTAVPASAPSTRAFRRPDSAEAFARGGAAEAALREECLDIIAGVCRDGAAESDALGIAREMAGVLEVQLAFADEFAADRAAHAYIRKDVHNVAAALRLERDTWTLIEFAWRSPDIRSNDMLSRRARLGFIDQPRAWSTTPAVLPARKNDTKPPTARVALPGIEICRRIIEWLETVAGEQLDRKGGPQVQPLDDPAYRWQYTCSRMGSVPNPDYPLLAGRSIDDMRSGGSNQQYPLHASYEAVGSGLEEVEVKAESRLCRELFRLLRAGRADQAEEVCRQAGQPWRAAALAGGKDASAISASGIKGGARRSWRLAAESLARSKNPSVTAHERAVCGILAGILEPALAVAESYEDQAWARLCVLVDRAIERTATAPQSTGRPSDSAHADPAIDISLDHIIEVFRECQGAGSLSLRETVENARGTCEFGGMVGQQLFYEEESITGSILERIRSIRSYLALGPSIPQRHVRGLLKDLADLGKDAAQEGLEWACRFAAHIAIFVKEACLIQADDGHDPVALASFEQCMVLYARFVIAHDGGRGAGSAVVSRQGGSAPIRPIVYDLVARHLSHIEDTDLLVDVYTDVMTAALRGDLEQEMNSMIRAGGGGGGGGGPSYHEAAPRRQVHERRTLCLHGAGKCFGRHGRETLIRIVISSVDRVWAQHLPKQVLMISDSASAVTATAGGGGELEDGRQRSWIAAPEYDEMSHDEEMVVRAIEFLIFPGFSNYEEALRRVTCAARRFFLTGKYGAARYLVEWFPADALAEIGGGRCVNELHELDCWRAYMEAVSRHNEWRRFYYAQRPDPLSAEVRAAALAGPGQVTYELQAAANLKMEAYTNAMEAYTRVSAAARDAAVSALRVALLFDGGWMRDVEVEDEVEDEVQEEEDGEGEQDEEDEGMLDVRAPRRRRRALAQEQQHAQRVREVAAVRKIGVPQLAALLHFVLHESGLYGEAVELATVIADESLGLYGDFARGELRSLMRRIAQSAVLLADATSVKEAAEGEAGEGDGGGVSWPYTGTIFEEVLMSSP